MKAYFLASLGGLIHGTIFSFAFLSGIVSLYFVAHHLKEKEMRWTLIFTCIVFVVTFFLYAWRTMLMYQNSLTCMATT